MTSQKKLPLVITLLLILSLFLVACERPLPDDGSIDVPVEEAPDPGSYPGPAEGEGAYPGQPETQADDGGSGYPAPDAGPAQPAEEAPPAEAYPPVEGEESAEEPVEGETPEEAVQGETAEEQPAEGEATAEPAVEEPTAEGEAEQEATAEGEQPAEAPETEETGGERTHVVAAGENLYQIGLQYGISWVAIAQANGIVNPDAISVGQELIIPDLSESSTEDEDAAAETTEEATAESDQTTETSEEAVQPSDEEEEAVAAPQTTYIVQSGDNLYRISLMFGVNMMDVARANDLANFDDLAVGQELIIPGVEESETEETESGGETAAPAAEEATHVVAEGETVFGIAFQYGIAWTRLVERNDLSSPYTLEPGQTLIIPAEE